jgi:GNAT superfamily N-acetyltransferase
MRIRGFQDRADAGAIRRLVTAQGWNPGRHDVETFTAADPEAWLLAEVDRGVVGAVLATRWNDAFGWIGLYIVDEAHRGRGIGLALFRAALDRLAPATVGLDGDASQQENYRRSGFADVHANTRWHGPAAVWRGAGPSTGTEVATAGDVAFDALVALDARATGSPRPRLLRAWLDQPEAISVATVEEGAVTGFATVRPAASGWKVGPLVAPDPRTAAALVAAAVSGLADDTVCWLDTPAPNAAATTLLRQRGYERAPTSARMVRGAPPDTDLSLLFALLAHEVG